MLGPRRAQRALGPEAMTSPPRCSATTARPTPSAVHAAQFWMPWPLQGFLSAPARAKDSFMLRPASTLRPFARPAWGFYTQLVCSIALGPARGAGSSAPFFLSSGKTATTSFFACAPGLRRVYSHVTLVATRLTLTAPPLQKGREERSAQSVVRCRDPCAPSVPSTIVELR